MCSINMIIVKTQNATLKVLFSELRNTLSRLSGQTVRVIVTVRKSLKREYRVFIDAKGNAVNVYSRTPLPLHYSFQIVLKWQIQNDKKYLSAKKTYLSLCICIYRSGFGALFCRHCKNFTNDTRLNNRFSYIGCIGRILFPWKARSE